MKRLALIPLISQYRESLILILYILLAVVIDYALQLLAQVFHYEGFIYSRDIFKTIFSYGLIIPLSLFTIKFTNNKISGLYSLGIFCMMVLPGSLYFMRNDVEYWHLFLLLGSYIWFVLFYTLLDKIPFRINYSGNKTIFFGIIILITILTHGLNLYYLGLKFNLNLSLVYNIRDHFLKHGHFPLGYLVIWQGNIINPLLFFYGFEKRNFFLMSLVIISQIYLFSTTGIKLFLFSLIFSFLVTYFSKSLKSFIPITLCIIILLSSALYIYFRNVWFLALFVERSLFIPVQVTYHYFDFFQDNPFVYLSDSIFKSFVEYPYLLPIPLIIGIRYYNGASCNTGIFGNAYMNFGIPGVFLFVSAFALFLSLFDRIAEQKKGKSIIIASLAMPLISILNSGLLTVLLTHGMLLAFILTFFLKKEGNLNINKVKSEDTHL